MEERENQEFTVLLIDDDDIIRENARAFLEDYDYNVLDANNGPDGIEIFNNNKVDIVICDLKMPVMDGAEVIKIISEINSNIPIIVVSGTGVLKEAIQAIRLGAWDYITKPVVDMEALLHVIENSLEKSILIKENELYKTNLENLVKYRTKDLQNEIRNRIEIEKKLKESEEFFRYMVQSIPGVIFKANIDTMENFAKNGAELTFISNNIENLTGYTVNDFLSHKVKSRDIVCKEDKERVFNEITRSLETNGSYTVEYKVVTKDEKEIWITESAQGIFDENKKIIGITGTAFDISAKKMFEEKMKDAVKELEKADRLKNEFLANMSHEIRTPMTSIIGFSDLMEGTDLDQNQKTYLDFIKKSSAHLLEIMNDILDLAKIESAQIEISKDVYDFYNILAEVEMFVTTESRNKKTNLELRVKKPEKNEITITTDGVRLKQVLINLLSNALKFTEKGYVELDWKFEDDNMIFFVNDTGIGIPENKMEEIFEKFTQVDASFTRKYGGVGLGLALCKKLTHVLGGSIDVKSKVGEGSTFIVTIPLNYSVKEKKVVLEEVQENYTIDTSIIREEHEKPVILIADDTKENIMFLKAFLEKTNYDVIVAENGQQAVDRYGENKTKIDLILMDIQMPVMNGQEAMLKIKEQCEKERNNVPVLALTAHAMVGDAEKYLKAGFDGYIAKPFRINQILSSIASYIK